MAAVATPRIKLYTNHGCPWAHRAHIALSELNVPFDEEIIDLTKPRTPEYLKVNPRGLVPTIELNGETVAESAVVATLLADAFPSKLWPASTDANGPIVRARINFFVDAYFSKAHSLAYKTLTARTEEEEQTAVDAFVGAISKEVEPLLADAAPFFGGSSSLTLAEVLTGSFLLRLYAFPKHGLQSSLVLDSLAAKTPNFDRWAKEVIKHPSVRSIWDEEKVVRDSKARFEKIRASA